MVKARQPDTRPTVLPKGSNGIQRILTLALLQRLAGNRPCPDDGGRGRPSMSEGDEA